MAKCQIVVYPHMTRKLDSDVCFLKPSRVAYNLRCSAHPRSGHGRGTRMVQAREIWHIITRHLEPHCLVQEKRTRDRSRDTQSCSLHSVYELLRR